METIEIIRFAAGALFLFLGLLLFVIEVLGVFHMKYVLNRMHAAAIGDTLGICTSLIGVMILSGFNFTTLKLAFIVVFLWFTSPVATHLLARLEVTTAEELEKNCEVEKE